MAFASISAHCTALGRTACVVHSKQQAVTCKATSPQSQSWRRTQQLRRPTPVCRAEERSRDSTKTSEAERLKAPDMPPAKDSSRNSDVGFQNTNPASRHRPGSPILRYMQEEASTSQAQTSGTSDISDELRALQQRKRQQSQSAAPTGYIQNILQEIRLIEWPTPKQALLNTVLVIAIVGASSVVLFAINSTLAELSKLSYK